MKIGYARVSTGEQILDLQIDALQAAGCDQLFRDVISGSKDARPGLDQALSHLRTGDTLVVWRLDRLGRTLKYLIELLNQLAAREIGFRSLTEQIDTTTPGGKLIFHIFGALAEFERDLIKERTRAGLAAARARGRKGGHPRVQGLDDPRKIAVAKSLYADSSNSIASICSTLKVSKSTLYRYLREAGVNTSNGKSKPKTSAPPADQAVEAAHA
jgi:DNA invertase Pin-like site-specific DNA recombinase